MNTPDHVELRDHVHSWRNQLDCGRIRDELVAKGFDQDTVRRILMTLSCSDSDAIPKVLGAGDICEQNGCRFQLMHNGVRVLEDCYYGRWMRELIRLLRGHHEPQEEKVFHAILKHMPPGATMIELGSFWSYYSLWFQQSIPAAKTYMVEPDPNNLEVGKRNFALNGRSGHFFQYALARQSSEPRAFHCESDQIERPVAQISVDDFVQQNRIEFVDLLLADVQGAELEVLQGAERTIRAGKIRFVCLSTHHHSISGDPIIHQRCLQFLQNVGAHVLAAHAVSESFSGDGLIAAALLSADRHIVPVSITKNWPTNSLFRELEFDLADAQAARDLVTKQLLELQDQYERQGRGLGAPNAELIDLRRQLADDKSMLSSVLNSTSWKMTRPIRAFGRGFRKLKHLVI